MRTILNRAQAPDGVVLALLSGTYSEPEDFVREGFPEAVRAHGIGADIVVGAGRAAWFADGSIVGRIRGAIVLPAPERGGSRDRPGGSFLRGLAPPSSAPRPAGDTE